MHHTRFVRGTRAVLVGARFSAAPVAQRLVCAMLLLASTLACRDGGGTSNGSEVVSGAPAATSVSPASTEPSLAELAALVSEWGQGHAQVVRQPDPLYFFGDFDGDGNTDAAVVVRFSEDGASRRMASGATVLNPWLRSAEPAAKDLHDAESDKALFVFHGTGTQWNARAPKSVFVLLDAVYDELKIVRRGSVDDVVKLPEAAKGDGFLTGTEAAKGIIYWDGRTYLWKQHGD